MHASKLTSKILELQERFDGYKRDRIADVVSKMEVLEDKILMTQRCNEERAEVACLLACLWCRAVPAGFSEGRRGRVRVCST